MSGNLKALGILVMTVSALCALASGMSRAEMLQVIGESQGFANTVAWPGYIERGEIDPAFDLVTASGDASLRLIYGDRMQEVKIGLIQSYDTFDPRLQNALWHTVAGSGK